MEVSILIAIIVPDMTPFGAANSQGIGWHGLERTGDTQWQRRFRSLMERMRPRSTLPELRFLASNDLFNNLRIDRKRFPKHNSSFPVKTGMARNKPCYIV